MVELFGFKVYKCIIVTEKQLASVTTNKFASLRVSFQSHILIYNLSMVVGRSLDTAYSGVTMLVPKLKLIVPLGT